MPSYRFISLAALIAAAVLSQGVPATAKDKVYTDPDWPCVARKVIEISPGQIWDGPSLEGAAGWQSDDKVRTLSGYLISRRIKLEDMEAAVKKFADGQPAADRDKKLSELFAAVLSRSNDERKTVITGIERFHKRQLARAANIEKAGIALPKDTDPIPAQEIPAGEIDKISPEEDKFKWEVRVFQERQQSIPLACEIPQLIEERAGAIARAIRAQMKG
jgi:hypothetical protein